MNPTACDPGSTGRTAWLLLPACFLFPAIAHAQTDPLVTVDVSVNTALESNPFLEPNGVSSLSASLQVDPKIYWEDETSSVALDASLRVSQYLTRYGNDIGGRIGIQARKQLDTRTSLSSGAGFQSSRATLQDFFLGNLTGPLDPVKFPEVAFTDVTIAGRRARVTTWNSYLGLDHTLSEDDSINIFGAATYSKFGGMIENDYRTGTLGVRYRRRLSERTSVTAGMTAGVADYIGVNSGDARIFSPQIGIERKMSERLNWTASVGVSVASVDNEQRVARTTTYLTGNLSLCDKGVKTTFCGSLSRSAEPTAFGGIRAVTNVAVVFDRQLSLKERLSLSGRYGQTSKSSTPILALQPRGSKIYGVSATYSNQINERFSFIASPSLTKAVERPFRDETNYSFMIGIKLRLGKLR